MEKPSKTDWRFSTESVVEDAIAKSSIDVVRDIFSIYGAHGVDDLQEDCYAQAFSDPMLLAND